MQAPSAPPFLGSEPTGRTPSPPPSQSAAHAASAPTEPDDDPSDPRSDPSCNNANGSLVVCSVIGPACEGLFDECMGLRDLRPRVAQKFGECFAKARRPSCRDKAMGACMRAAVMPSQDPNGWPKVDAERLGPTVEEGCTLRNVLPYQPWGPSWDGTFDRLRRGSRP